MDQPWPLVVLAGFGTAFGAYALYLGYNNVLISSVFGFIGTLAGYIVGKKTSKTEE